METLGLLRVSALSCRRFAVSSPFFGPSDPFGYLSVRLHVGMCVRRRSLLVKFNFVEVAIVPGLVKPDTGGSGDLSVLSGSERMHLMPFAAITNRIGGTLVLFLTSLMVPMLAL